MNNDRLEKIISEYTNANNILKKHNINNIVVQFGSARILSPESAKNKISNDLTSGDNNYKNIVEISKYYDLAKELSYKLATHFKTLPNNKKCYMCSGGGGGIMEATNLGASLAGEKSLGFNIVLPFEQKGNKYITNDLLITFDYFFLRKFWFSYLAKAFVVFPGGFGTMDEMFENLTLMQTHKMKKKVPFIFFGKDFFNNLINMDVFIKYNLINKIDLDLIFTTDSVDEAFEYIVNNISLHEDNQ